MSNNFVSDSVNIINNVYDSVKKNYERNEDIIKYGNQYIKDFYHEVEFGDKKDMYQTWLMVKEFREVLNQRRIAKEQNELMKELYNFLNTKIANDFCVKMRSIQGDSVKIENIQKDRRYFPRVMIDASVTDKVGKSTHNNDENKKSKAPPEVTFGSENSDKSFNEMMRNFRKEKPYKKNGKIRK